MARFDPRRASALLQEPEGWRVILLHGDDVGLIRDRAEMLRRAVAGPDDPFRVAELSCEALRRDPALLSVEAASLPLTGGRRCLRVRETTDGIAAAVELALAAAGEALIVLEAPDLPSRSRLRALVEAAPGAVAVPCWRERGEALVQALTGMFEAGGLRVEGSALAWLAARLDGDRETLRRECEKLSSYAGPGGVVDEAAVLALSSDESSLELDDALFAATSGDLARTDRALDAALAGGLAPVALLRATQRHLLRLHSVVTGLPMAALRPPVFFRHQPSFEKAARLWSKGRLERASDAVALAERRAKSGSASRALPEVVLAAAAVLALAQEAAALSRRSGGG